MYKKKFITALLSLSCCFYTTNYAFSFPKNKKDLTQIAENLIVTGVDSSTITALVNPEFTTVSLASMALDDSEQVFIVASGALKPLKEREVIIVPQRIMVWHEVLNMIESEKAYALTYSPISAGLAAYSTKRDKLYLQLQSDGRQYNANSVLVDLNTNSRWSQMYGLSFMGTLAGMGLELIPTYWTTWDKAKNFFIDKPDAKVLLTPRANKRYGTDPYGSYMNPESFYYNDQLIYPVSRIDTRMGLKEMVIGLEIDKEFTAVNINYVKKKGVVNFFLGKKALVAVHDTRLDVVRIFDRTVWYGKDPLVLRKENKNFSDLQTKSTWDFDGVCRKGNYLGSYMKEYFGVYAFWYSYAANNPETDTIPGKSEVPDSALETGVTDNKVIGEDLKGPVENSSMGVPWN